MVADFIRLECEGKEEVKEDASILVLQLVSLWTHLLKWRNLGERD